MLVRRLARMLIGALREIATGGDGGDEGAFGTEASGTYIDEKHASKQHKHAGEHAQARASAAFSPFHAPSVCAQAAASRR